MTASPPNNSIPDYQLHQVIKRYHNRTVLHIDQLDIHSGEILAIVGPSGAGKSTLLRQLAFLERPTQGQLIFNNHSLHEDIPPLETRRQVTLVFQKPVLLSRSVAANVAYGLKIRGKPKAVIQQTVTQILERVGLSELIDAPAKTLSGGEAQRVALARALVIEPTVLLLDEPTANLDPYNINLIEQIISEVNETRGTTIVLVTHNIFQAKRLAHRTALILDSRLVEVSDTETFFNNPTDPRTAAFVRGDMVY